jgi:hypothetical protein
LVCHARALRLLRASVFALLIAAGGDPAAAQRPAAGAAPGAPPNDFLPSKPLTGAVFSEIQIRDLPSSGSLWSLIETADQMTVVDRIQNGGLYLGEPELMGNLGSSWTQTGFTFDGLDLTNPARTGTPLAYLAPQVLSAVQVTTAVAPVDAAGGGATVSLSPRAPAREWGGHLQAAYMPSAWQAEPGAEEAPAIAWYDAASQASALLSGPLASNGSGILLSGRRGVVRRFERTADTLLQNRLTSLFAHAILNSSSGGRLRVLAGTDALSRPFAGRLRFPDRGVTAKDRYWQAHAVWERASSHGTAWSLAAGFARGVSGAPADLATPTVGAIERLIDGPVLETVLPTSGVVQRTNAVLRVRPDLRRASGGWQTVDFGASASRTSSAEDAMPRALVGELVDGLPARAWDVTWGGPSALRHGTELAAWVNDRIDIGSRVTLEVGARAELMRADARDNPEAISWRGIQPRGTLQINLTPGGGLSFHAGYARFRHRLPLEYLAYGDASAPAASVYRWIDNGDRRLQPSEMKTLVARAGPGIGTLDPGLLSPYTDEFAVGFQARFGRGWRWRAIGVERKQRRLVAPVNVGVTLADFTLRQLPDRGNDFFNPIDDRLLPVYDRKPSAFGRDRYVLTNPDGHTGTQVGVDFAFERLFDGRWYMLFGASAQRSDAYAGNPGFHANENDWGVLGELFENPNALSYARARQFVERGYIIKWSGGFVMPDGTHVGAIARYQDGQHFGRMVVVSDLNQGPEAIQAYTRGHSRFTFSFTLDARLEKRFRVGGAGGVALVVEGFNLLNNAIEVEEDPVVTREFRATTAVQPPRAMRIGFRIDF